MKSNKILLFLIIWFASFQIFFAQEIDFEGNWYRDTRSVDDSNSRYEFEFYTKGDVINAKRRFDLIKQSPLKNDWEGIYAHNVEIGEARLHWNSESGFVYYFVYHTLRQLDFGSALDQIDSVNLSSEKSSTNKRKSIFFNNLVKVKFGDRHYLVPENRLQDFVDRTAGLNTDIIDFNYYLQKPAEYENKVYGLPVLPEKYKKFLRYPIDTKIIRVGNRRVIREKHGDADFMASEEINYFVTLRAGKNKKVKVGMNFFADDLGEWIEITKVLPNNSVGKIKRMFDENKQEECRDSEGGQGQIVPCKEIKAGMKVRTKVSESFF